MAEKAGQIIAAFHEGGWSAFPSTATSNRTRGNTNRLIAKAHQRKFDAIVVWKIDRFGRSLRHLVTALADLAAYGVAFISLRDNLDLSTPSGRLMFHVIAAMAEFQRDLIRERVKAGLRVAKAKGKILGRPRVSVDAHAVARLRSEGHTWPEICRNAGSVSSNRSAGCAGSLCAVNPTPDRLRRLFVER